MLTLFCVAHRISSSLSLSPKPSYSMPFGGHLCFRMLEVLWIMSLHSLSFSAKCPGTIAPRRPSNWLFLKGQVVPIMCVACAAREHEAVLVPVNQLQQNSAKLLRQTGSGGPSSFLTD